LRLQEPIDVRRKEFDQRFWKAQDH
jgi:hypothetical protein